MLQRYNFNQGHITSRRKIAREELLDIGFRESVRQLVEDHRRCLCVAASLSVACTTFLVTSTSQIWYVVIVVVVGVRVFQDIYIVDLRWGGCSSPNSPKALAVLLQLRRALRPTVAEVTAKEFH